MFDYYSNEMLERLGIPNTYKKINTVEYQYWFRSLLQKIDSSLIFSGLPEEWPEDFFKFILWARGYIAVFKTERWGITCQPASSLSGYDFYYQPQKVAIANPYYNKILTMHKEVELIKLTPDFHGIFDVIAHYATQLAELTKSIQMQFINAKVPMVLVASDKAQSETLKAVYDQVQEGESLVIWKDRLTNDEIIPRKDPFTFWNQDFKQTYIAGDLLQNLREVLNNFYMEIGLPSDVDPSKAHKLNQQMDMQTAQSQARIACWVSNLNESFERVEKLFGLKLEVDYAKTNFDADGDDSSQDGDESERKLGNR